MKMKVKYFVVPPEDFHQAHGGVRRILNRINPGKCAVAIHPGNKLGL